EDRRKPVRDRARRDPHVRRRLVAAGSGPRHGRGDPDDRGRDPLPDLAGHPDDAGQPRPAAGDRRHRGGAPDLQRRPAAV
ncbi:MAG: hypothetical protein AVDCRST_MAG41-4587, partial [uncultured Corynebacteriales bacterium]